MSWEQGEERRRQAKAKNEGKRQEKQKAKEKKIFILKDSYTIKFDVTKTGFGGERGVIL